MKALLFPGQGSQLKGMGKDVFSRYPGLTRFASEVLGYDLAALCLEDPEGKLAQTQYTQPALFTVQALLTFERAHREEAPADVLLGHSLGEYNALLAAGSFDFATGLRLVRRRGELMAAASGGGMSAVMNVTPERLSSLLREHGVGGLEFAGFNTDTQLVIAGSSSALQRAQDVLRQHQITTVPLRVSAPFHSSYMEPARAQFESFLADVDFREPAVPVISNVTGRPHERGSIARLLCEQLVRAVRWTDSIRYLLGVEPRVEFTEIRGRTLTQMVEQIRKPVANQPV